MEGKHDDNKSGGDWLEVLREIPDNANRWLICLCAPGCDAGGREFETPTGPTLRVFK